MCSCSKVMMLEVGEPGELPLMKELTTLKKSCKPKKSPLLEGVSADAQESVCAQPLDDEETASRERHTMEYSQEYAFYAARDTIADIRRDRVKGASSRNAKSPLFTPSKFDPTNVRSPPPMNDFSSKIMNWDSMPGDALRNTAGLERAATDCLQRESLRNHLEKLGILGEGRGLDAHSMKETSLLHNWRNASDDWQSHAIHAENFELKPSAHAWNQQEFLHARMPLKNRTGNSLVYDETETSVMQTSLSRPTKDDRWWGANAQTLSPLVLNPHDDNHKFSHARHAFFALDEEHSDTDDEDGEDYEEEYIRVENRAQGGNFMYQKEVSQAGTNTGLRSRSPLHSHKKQATPSGTRFSKMNSPRGYRPGTSETEYFEYDLESLEQPSKRKESAKPYDQKPPLNRNQPIKQHSFTQENSRSSVNAMKSIRRKNGSFYECHPITQQQGSNSASKYALRSPEVEPLPLLTELEDYNGSDEYGGSSNDGDFERSSLSELNFSACKNGHNAGTLAESRDVEQLQLTVQNCKELALCEDRPRNLSQKYRPKAFEEVVGQPIVTQALSTAILKGRIAPVYLFQGSRGTGKTTAARIFAAALTCMSSEGKRPCGACRECVSVASGKSSEVKEVDAASNNGIERVKALLEETISAPPLSRYKVFIVDECHVLTAETWNALLRVLEEPPTNVVFILITTDPDQLPRTALSRCQKFPFPKIKDAEIVKRLQKLVVMENLSIDPEILQLIASRADGSLRDAETTLDQVTLLGQNVNQSTLHELVGCAPDEKILGLLEAALVADTVNTVRRARELVDSGMEPLSLMSRIAKLITDILAGTFKFTENQRRGFFQKQSFSEEKLERLRMAMKILSEAEKQLRASNDRTTWLTAALLQLGPDRTCMFSASCAGTSVTQSPVALDDMVENEANDFDHRSSDRRAMWPDHDTNHTQEFGSTFAPQDGKAARQRNTYAHENSYWTDKVSQEHAQGKGPLEHSFMDTQTSHGSEQSRLEDDPLDISFKDPTNEQKLSPTKLDDIWAKVIERCRSLPLRQLLDASVTLTSISITEVDATIYLGVGHHAHKSSCERSQKSIANLFEMVLGFPVEVKISLASLPAEDEEDEDLRTTQGSAGNHIHIYPEGAAPKGYDWRKQESITKSNTPHQSHATKSFPAIIPSVENQHFVASTWRSVACVNGGKQPEHQSAAHKVEGATLLQEPRGLSSMTASAPGGTATYGAHGQLHKGDTHGYIHNQVSDDINTEEERIINNLEGLSPNSFEVTDLHDKSRLRQCAHKGSKDSQALHNIDERKSHDAEAKQKDGSLRMVRRLSIRNHGRSSDPNSPDEKGSYLRVPRFSMKSHTNPQKYKDLQSPKEASEQIVDPDEAAASTQKKGIFKGAVGGFARLFQGKALSKEGAGLNR